MTKFSHQRYMGEKQRRNANCLLLCRYLLCHGTSPVYCSYSAALVPSRRSIGGMVHRNTSRPCIYRSMCVSSTGRVKPMQVFYFPEFLRIGVLNTIRHSNLIKKRKVDLLWILQKNLKPLNQQTKQSPKNLFPGFHVLKFCILKWATCLKCAWHSKAPSS